MKHITGLRRFLLFRGIGYIFEGRGSTQLMIIICIKSGTLLGNFLRGGTGLQEALHNIMTIHNKHHGSLKYDVRNEVK